MTNPNEPSSPNSNAIPDPEKPSPTVEAASSNDAPPEPVQPASSDATSVASSSSSRASATSDAAAARASLAPPPPPPRQDEGARSDGANAVPPSLASLVARVQPRVYLPLAGRPTRLDVPPRRGEGRAMAGTGCREALMMPHGGGIQVGGGGGGAAGARGLLPQGERAAQRRKIVFVDPPGKDPMCSVCGRKFLSWKALFGHLRSHPERQWRGCYPPPLFNGEEDQARHLRGRRARLDIDLNRPQEMEEGSDAGNEEPEGGSGDIDLNEPPAKEESK